MILLHSGSGFHIEYSGSGLNVSDYLLPLEYILLTHFTTMKFHTYKHLSQNNAKSKYVCTFMPTTIIKLS